MLRYNLDRRKSIGEIDMFYDYDIENMKIEEMDIVGELETIDESIKNIKKTMKETGENLKSVLDDMEYYKKKYGGDISVEIGRAHV